MENIPAPEVKPSLINRISNLVKEKRMQVAEKYGGSDWRTKGEILNATKIFMGGVTVAVGLAFLANQPSLTDSLTGIATKVVAGSVGLVAVGSEAWAMFKTWAVGEKRNLKAQV